MDHDQLIKHVFDNLRNLFLTISLTTMGGAVIRYHKQLGLEPWMALLILVVLVILSCLLLTWNAIHGVTKLLQGKHRSLILIILPIYLGIAIVGWKSIPLLTLKATSEASSHS